MNPRIQELWQQAADATAAYPSGQNNSWETQVNFLEKFAELIVRECAEVCMKEIDTGWVMAPKSPWMAKQILEHFGVEE